MAAMPAGGSLVAASNYYQRCISSTSSSSSCGESSFFFDKQPGMTPLTEEEHLYPLPQLPSWHTAASYAQMLPQLLPPMVPSAQ
uniref:Uncharacterized protein n=1 Tax=Neolamprologus brichardi TaxID=32507 RepID=A0A3Q4GID8_NEOBR